jgi:uncharacterized membrane protein YfcA
MCNETAVGRARLMDITQMMYPLSGLLVGFLVGLTGVGGGSLMTPLLVLVFGIHPTTAVGTDLLYAAATKSVGTLVHQGSHTVEWRIVRRLALGSVPATALTLIVLRLTGSHSQAASHAVTLVLGVALVLTAIATLFRGWTIRTLTTLFGAPSDAQSARLTVLAGVVLGVLVSISSVGAGAIGVTALIVLYPQVPLVRIVGSDIAHAVPLTLLAGMGHWAMGDVDWALCGSLLVGSVPGIIIGSTLAPRLPEPGLRPVLAAVLLLVGGRLVY